MYRRADGGNKSRGGNFLSRNRHIWGRILLAALILQALYVVKQKYGASQPGKLEEVLEHKSLSGHDLSNLFVNQRTVKAAGSAIEVRTEEVGPDEVNLTALDAIKYQPGKDAGWMGNDVEKADPRVESRRYNVDQRGRRHGLNPRQLEAGNRLASRLAARARAQEEQAKRNMMEELTAAGGLSAGQGQGKLTSPARKPSQVADVDGDSAAGNVILSKFLGELPGVNDRTVWQVPLGKPTAAGMTCKAWLEEQDKVDYKRDFRTQPVIVSQNEEKRWECDVGCVHHGAIVPKTDAVFHSKKDGMSAVLRSMEPRSYYSINDVNNAHNSGYKVAMTVHLDSDVPVGYFSWEEYDIMKPLPEKNAWPALAVAFISNCNANNFRIQALEKMQQTMAVDSYGRCSRNRPRQDNKAATIAHYKFCLAFENSCEPDYVTEKFWQSLVAGCIPVVIGAPNIEDFTPSNMSIVHIKTMEEVDRAIREMKEIDQDPEKYKQLTEWKRLGPSDQFKALVDMSAVHSSCRLCIFLADDMRLVEEKERVGHRPCRCRASPDAEVIYHIYVRERGRFYFTSIFLQNSELTLEAVELKISSIFKANGHVPVWRPKRPKILVSEKDLDLPIYRIYPVGSTQRAALYGDAWFRDDAQLRDYLGKHPCANLEVMFV